MVSGAMPAQELKEHPWLQINATLAKPLGIVELLKTVKEVLGAGANANEFKKPLQGESLAAVVCFLSAILFDCLGQNQTVSRRCLRWA